MIEKILERLEELDRKTFRISPKQAMAIVQEVAKEYGKDTKAHSRCDTCTHYVADEVPPICYMCSKGIEDNYERKGE